MAGGGAGRGRNRKAPQRERVCGMEDGGQRAGEITLEVTSPEGVQGQGRSGIFFFFFQEANETPGEEAFYMLQERSQWRRCENMRKESPERQVQNSGSIILLEQEGHTLFSDGRIEVGMGTRVDRDLWRAEGGKWSEVIPSGPKFIRERRAQHLLREGGKGVGAWGERGCGNSEGHGRGQVQEGPRSPGRPALVVPQTVEGCDVHPAALV